MVVAIPKLQCAFEMVQSALLLDFPLRVRGGPDLDANLQDDGATEFVLDDRESFAAGPGGVGNEGSFSGIHPAFGQNLPMRKELPEQIGDFGLIIAVFIPGRLITTFPCRFNSTLCGRSRRLRS